MNSESFDAVRLNFSQDSLWVLNICLGIIMFGVALGIHLNDFRAILRQPKPAVVGIISQFIVLPAITFLLVLIMHPAPSIALGMIMVAACPGGNISNFFSQAAGGNAALSVSLTAFSTGLAIIFTPLNLQIWGSLYEPTANILRAVEVSPAEVFQTVVQILLIPLLLGMWVNHYRPNLAYKLIRILRPLSMVIFIGFVAIAFSNNFDVFLRFIGLIMLLVLVHNAVALGTGYGLGWITGLNVADRKTLSIETGIQNSGLALLLIFSFFDGLGGMAIIAGWWGIWHIVSGMAVSFYWSPDRAFFRPKRI